MALSPTDYRQAQLMARRVGCSVDQLLARSQLPQVQVTPAAAPQTPLQKRAEQLAAQRNPPPAPKGETFDSWMDKAMGGRRDK
jgi:hypothetical protein